MSSNNRFYWIVVSVASIVVGVSAGYSWWGDTASVVTIVEQELANSQAQVRMLEKRVKALETKLGIEGDTAAVDDPSTKAY
jgi:hypothetical protein